MANTTNVDNPGKQDGGDKGDNRSNTDRDGNRGAAKQGGRRQPGNIPDSDRGGTPSVGQDDQDDQDKSNRDRGDGTKRGGDERP